MAVAFTRVTVGKTAWLLRKLTPSWRNRHRLGVSSGVIESGRKPSSTRTMLSVARPAAVASPTPTMAPSTAAASAAIIRPMVFSPGFWAFPDSVAGDGIQRRMHIYEGQPELSDVRQGPRHCADRLSRRRQDHSPDPHIVRAAWAEIRRHRQRIR